MGWAFGVAEIDFDDGGGIMEELQVFDLSADEGALLVHD